MSKIFHAGECLAVFSDKIKHENNHVAPLFSTQILDDLLLTVGWLPVVLLFFVLFVHVHIYIYYIIMYTYIYIYIYLHIGNDIFLTPRFPLVQQQDLYKRLWCVHEVERALMVAWHIRMERKILKFTLPETNIAPENRGSQKESFPRKSMGVLTFARMS